MSSLVNETYLRPHNSLLLEVDKQAMINFNSHCSEVVSNVMNSGQQESNTHIVNEFDRHNQTFVIIETQSLLQTLTQPERFRVMLQS